MTHEQTSNVGDFERLILAVLLAERDCRKHAACFANFPDYECARDSVIAAFVRLSVSLAEALDRLDREIVMSALGRRYPGARPEWRAEYVTQALAMVAGNGGTLQSRGDDIPF
jgi:hypothetical protein